MQYAKNEPSCQDNGDGTITDLVMGLMWAQSVDMDNDGDIDAADKKTYDEALAGAESFDLAGYDDWRLPTIKEQYSLILFSGMDPSGYDDNSTDGLVPFIDTDTFDFAYGDTDAGERIIDTQYASSSLYCAGAQCSDPKDGDPAEYPTGFGPQGDAIRIFNHVRCFRDI